MMQSVQVPTRPHADLIGEYLASRDAAATSEWYEPNPDDSIPGRARAKQRPPDGEWFTWFVMAGRGFGKTRTGAEWINSVARSIPSGEQVLVAGRTPADVRSYSLTGRGGLLTHYPDIEYEPSNRRLIWPNGVIGLIRSGANPGEFRGFSGDYAWLDEFAAWDYPAETWQNLILSVREADPRICITSTPRPIPTLKEIVNLPGTVVVRGSSRENEENLSDRWSENVLDPLQGTRIGRQEIDAEILDEVEGALWSISQLDALRVKPDDVPQLSRVAVGVDPQGAKIEGSETGIVAAGLGEDGHVYVLEDGSVNGSPNEWATRAVAVYERQQADGIVGERNFGGDMVEHTIRTVAPSASFKLVNASRGKRQRAQPVSALYEQGRGHHVGTFAALEDEMSSFTPDSRESPNRMDALVWAVWEVADLGNPRREWFAV